MKVKDLIGMSIDIDVYDDVCEELAIAFCGPMKLTETGAKVFADVMEYEIELAGGGAIDQQVIVHVDDPVDAVWKQRLKKAKRFFEAAAGWCSEEDYRLWFEEPCQESSKERIVKWYLIITTTIGKIDLGAFGNYYSTLEEAKRQAEKARTLDFVTGVEIGSLDVYEQLREMAGRLSDAWDWKLFDDFCDLAHQHDIHCDWNDDEICVGDEVFRLSYKMSEVR